MDSLQTSSLDIPPWLQSNGNPTPAKFSERDQQKDGFPSWLSGKEMSETSTHPNTKDEWIAFMRGSLVKILASQEIRQVLAKAPAAGFTEKSCELLGQLDPSTYSWKMSPQLKATALSKLSKTWPSWGMTVDGCAYEHPMSGHHMRETDGFVLDSTPTATMPIESENPSSRIFLLKSGRPRKMSKNGTSGSLNWAQLMLHKGFLPTPMLCEYYMGFPISFTDIKPSEMVKFRSKSQPRLPSWLRSK